jgi:Glycosyltransferase family 87
MPPEESRRDSLYLLLFAGAFFLAFGFLLESSSRAPMQDFWTAYSSAECLVRFCDPYSQNDVLRAYSEYAGIAAHSPYGPLGIAGNLYPPSEFAFTVPFALLAPRQALWIWFLFLMGGFLLAVFLMWNLAASKAPAVAAILLSYILVTSESLPYFGNPGGMAISLCVIAAWCFLRQRFELAGVVCLAFGLALKPQDAFFVWLFFLLSGGTYRKRALQTVALAAVVSLPPLLWVMHLSPHWIAEVRSTQQQFFAHGSYNDPAGDHGTCFITSLQVIASHLWKSPRIINLVSYLLCAPLLAIWIFVTLRTRPSQAKAWLGLASISVLSLLPIYHRQYDAKIILLTVPAFAMLWAGNSFRNRLTLLLATGLGYLLSGELLWAICLYVLARLGLIPPNHNAATAAALNFPVPLSLLLMGVFYLWAYAKNSQPDQSRDIEIRSAFAAMAS